MKKAGRFVVSDAHGTAGCPPHNAGKSNGWPVPLVRLTTANDTTCVGTRAERRNSDESRTSPELTRGNTKLRVEGIDHAEPGKLGAKVGGHDKLTLKWSWGAK